MSPLTISSPTFSTPRNATSYGILEMHTEDERRASKQPSKLTRQEAADRLRVHTDTLDRWADAGLIRPMRYPSPGGGRPTIRYALAEIERFERKAQSR